MLDLLLKHSADPNCVGYCEEYSKYCDEGYIRNDTVSPLMVVVWQLSLSNAELLLNVGANINQTNSIGQTSLHIYCNNFAAYQDKGNSIMKLLLSHNVDVNLRDSNGRTPLHYTCEMRNIDAVKLLLEAGAQLDIVDKGGFNELQIAAQSYFDADLKVKYLLESYSYPIQQIIEAYETLAWFYLRQDESNYNLYNAVDCMATATKLREEYNLPKTVHDPLECYGFVKEWETMEELLVIKDSSEQLKMQAILSRERIYRWRRPRHIPYREDMDFCGWYNDFPT